MTETPAVNALSWLKVHERIVIVFLVLLASAWGFSRFADYSAAKAEVRATTAEQTLAAQKEQNAQTASQITQLNLQYQQLTQILSEQNAKLVASVAARRTAQDTQVSVDAHLAPTDLSTRLQTLGNALPEEVAVSSAGNLELKLSGAVKITQTLEQISPLQANLRDTSATLQTFQKVQSEASALITTQTQQITNLNTTLVDQTKQCKAQVSEIKAQARKSKLRWFGAGFLAGLFVGHGI